jgi:hypothetical protein
MDGSESDERDVPYAHLEPLEKQRVAAIQMTPALWLDSLLKILEGEANSIALEPYLWIC